MSASITNVGTWKRQCNIIGLLFIGGSLSGLFVIAFFAYLMWLDFSIRDEFNRPKTGEMVMVFVFFVILPSICLVCILIKVLLWHVNDRWHPIYGACLEYGDPREVVFALENEFQETDVVTIANLTVTPSWVIQRPTLKINTSIQFLFLTRTHPFEFWMIRPQVIVWMYFQSYDLTKGVIWTQKVRYYYVRSKVKETFDEIRKHAPWIITKHDPRHALLWRRHKKLFIAHVEENRKRFENGEPPRREISFDEIGDIAEWQYF